MLRNRSTSDIYLVVLFTIHRAEDVNEDGSLKQDIQPYQPAAPADYGNGAEADHDEAAALEQARRHLDPTHTESSRAETSLDDLD